MPKVTQCRSMQNIWKNAFMFHGIMNLRTEDKRGVVYSRNIESYIGSELQKIYQVIRNVKLINLFFIKLFVKYLI